MRRALALAERGRGTTRPNPVVGAVVVRGAAGSWPRAFTSERASRTRRCMRSRALGGAARGTTLYVTLEPC